MISIEARGKYLLWRSIGKQVPRNLLNDKLVVRQVTIERFDHPVSPRPLRAFGVVLVPVCIGVPRRIEPASRHLFSVMGTGKQAIQLPLQTIGGRIIKKPKHILGRRRDAYQIKPDSSQNNFWRSRHRGAPSLRSAMTNKTVNGIPVPFPAWVDRRQ